MKSLGTVTNPVTEKGAPGTTASKPAQKAIATLSVMVGDAPRPATAEHVRFAAREATASRSATPEPAILNVMAEDVRSDATPGPARWDAHPVIALKSVISAPCVPVTGVVAEQSVAKSLIFARRKNAEARASYVAITRNRGRRNRLLLRHHRWSVMPTC